MTAEEFFVPGELYRWLGDSEIYLVLEVDAHDYDGEEFRKTHFAVRFLACDGHAFWRTSSRRAEVYDNQCSNFVKVT